MEIQTKEFQLTEVYIEDPNYNLVNEKAKEYRKDGFAVTNPTTHYGKHGKEEDKTYWVTGTKKEPVMENSENSKMDNELIKEVMKYIEEAVVENDSHYGARSFKQHREENDIPELYTKLEKMLQE